MSISIFSRASSPCGAGSRFCGSVHAAILLALMVLPGCAVKRDSYNVPTLTMPGQYRNAPEESAKVPMEKDLPLKKDSVQEAESSDWWRLFGNSELVELVDRVLANNQDIRIATLRLAQAKERSDQVRAGLMPTINAPMGAAIGSIPMGTSAAGSTTQKSYQASLSGNFRVDVWGEQSSAAEAANFQLWQAAFESDNVQRTMTSNLAMNYVMLLSLNDRMRVAVRTDALLRNMLTATKVRVNFADATLNELDQQKVSFYSARSVSHSLEQQRENALANIAFLVGTVPESLKLSSEGLDSIAIPAVVPALPSALLFRRPDIRMAEARLLAADANVDVARARILPPLDLSGQAGYSGLAINKLFQPSTFFWNALANVTVSIFDRGRKTSEKENAKAMHEEMVESYARTIYQAVSEVDNALATIKLTGQRLYAQQRVMASARRSWGNSVEAYRLGSIDYMALLEARRTYYRHQDEYQQVKLGLCHGYISLFHALGGGVNVAEPLPGKGVRPGMTLVAGSGKMPPQLKSTAAIVWENAADKASAAVENYWQVELSGLYHRQTVEPAWRDLATRYPKQMENRFMRPRLQGRVEGNADGKMSWYRLYINQFSTPDEAHQLCAAFQANYQRCRVISSHSDETVAAPATGKPPTDPVPVSSATKDAAPASLLQDQGKG